VYLYANLLRISPQTADNPDRDYLLLSKGHDVPALYGTLAELGYIERERLKNHLKTTDSIYWHPNRTIPGVEFHSGSLGHLLSVGLGIALDENKSYYIPLSHSEGDTLDYQSLEAHLAPLFKSSDIVKICCFVKLPF